MNWYILIYSYAKIDHDIDKYEAEMILFFNQIKMIFRYGCISSFYIFVYL